MLNGASTSILAFINLPVGWNIVMFTISGITMIAYGNMMRDEK